MSRRFHSLDLAARMGFSAAAVYSQLYTLCREQKKKKKKHRCYYDGHPWVPITSKDLPRLFPYMTAAAVVKALGELKDAGLVKELPRGDVSWFTII